MRRGRTPLVLLAICVLAPVPVAAQRASVAVRGPGDKDVRDQIERALGGLDIQAAGASVTVELSALSTKAVRFVLRVDRQGRSFVRSGVAAPDEAGRRVSSALLLALVARDPARLPRLALVVDSDRGRPPGPVLDAWRRELERRGYALVSDEEVALAREALPAKTTDPEAALSELVSARVVSVVMRNRGKDVAIQTTIVDRGPRRGDLSTVPPAAANDEVAWLLSFAPLAPVGRR